MQGVHLRKYGVETIINFELYEVDGVDLRTDAADAGSDCTIMKDEGDEATCTNDFVDEGKGYSITLSAAEMQAARIVVYVVDSATKVWLDKVIEIETYGHHSAQHSFDLDNAIEACSGTLTVETADTVFNLTATLGTLSGEDDSCNNMIICVKDESGSIFETRRITDYDGTNTRATFDKELTFPVDDGVDTWVLYRSAYAPVGDASISDGDMNTLVDKVWDEADADHMTQGTKGLKMHHSGRGRY